MASKPTKLPEWATGASRTLEPSAGEKTTGWQAAYKAPARKANWLVNLIYQWCDYVKDAIFVADAASGLDGVKGTGDGAGAGVHGVGGASGPGVRGVGVNGYGVAAEGDTTSPAYASLRVLPQNSAASIPEQGAIQVVDRNGKIINYNGSAFERQVPQNHAITATEQESIVGGGDAPFTTSQLAIPADTLRVGSTIRIKVCGKIVSGIGTNSSIGIKLQDQSAHVITLNSAALTTTGGFALDAVFTVRGVGGAVSVYGGVHGLSGDGADAVCEVDFNNSFDTTEQWDLFFISSNNPGTTFVVDLEQFVVDIT